MKPLLIGENNPVSLRPGHELYPLPEGCAGNRLWHMLSDAHRRRRGKILLPSRYLAAFERRNLVRAKSFDARTARAMALEMQMELFGSGRRIVCLGRKVQHAFSLPPLQPLEMATIGGSRWYAVPHPSGRNLWYNDEANRAAVGDLLLGLMEEADARVS